MVFNPSRSLSIGGVKRNPTKKRRRTRTRRRANPVALRTSARQRNPVRRRNPSTASGLLVAAVMAGLGVSLFDVITTKVIPQNSALIRIGVKFGGAWLFQSNMASKFPVIGKYKNDIALVLTVAGVVDAFKLWVLPIVSSTVGNLTGGTVQLLNAPAGDDGTTGNIYGNAYSPSYDPYAY